MKFVQVLANVECSSDLGNCCQSPELASIIDIVKKIIELFQIIVPIILLVMLIIHLIRLMMNPDEKNGLKKLFNRILAAMIIFFIPLFVELIVNMSITFSGGGGKLQFASCWKEASDIVSKQPEEHKFIPYIHGKVPSQNTETPWGFQPGTGGHNGREIVSYAYDFLGKSYSATGEWNGSKPYVATDSTGFIRGLFKYKGYELGKTAEEIWNDKSKYILIKNTNDIKAADLVIYEGHVALLTGNGKQIIHNKNVEEGIVMEDDYTKSGAVKGIIRIKGLD